MAKPRFVSTGHPKPRRPKPRPKKPGKPLGAPVKTEGGYRRRGSAYLWTKTPKGFVRIKGTARGGPGKVPFDPLQPLQGRAFNQEVSRNVNLKYGQPLQQVGQMQANVPTWYDQYRQQLAQQTQATQGAYNQAQQNVYNQANTAATQDEAQRQKIQQEAQVSAALRGTSAAPDVEGQQAAQARRALNSSFGGMIGAQGAAQYAYGGALQGTATASKIGALERLGQQKQNLLSERGDYASQVRGDLWDKERTYALNRSAFNLNVQKQRDTARHLGRQDANTRRANQLLARDKRAKNRLKKIDEQLKQQGQSETQRHNLETERQNLYKILHPGKGGGGGSRGGKGKAPTVDARNKYLALQGQAMDVRRFLGPKRDKRSISEVRRRLASRPGKEKVGLLQRNAALEIALSGHLSPGTYRALKTGGYLIPKRWKPR